MCSCVVGADQLLQIQPFLSFLTYLDRNFFIIIFI